MPGPWEDYEPQKQANAGPWEDYAQPQQQAQATQSATQSPPHQPGVFEKVGAAIQHPGQALLGAAKSLPGLFQSALPSAETQEDPLAKAQYGNQGMAKSPMLQSAYNKVAGAVGGATTPQGSAQEGGGILAGAAAAVPGVIHIGQVIANSIPNADRAASVLQELKSTIGHHTVNISNPGNAALDIRDFANRGGTMPKVVNDFIKRTTDPNLPPLTFAEARDFYSNATRISNDEFNRLTPPMKYKLTQFTKSLGGAIEDTADQAGKLQKYMGAMKEYNKASNLGRAGKEAESTVKGTIKKALIYGSVGAGAKYGMGKALDYATK